MKAIVVEKPGDESVLKIGEAPEPEAEAPQAETPSETPQVVSLDAFRRRSPKE